MQGVELSAAEITFFVVMAAAWVLFYVTVGVAPWIARRDELGWAKAKAAAVGFAFTCAGVFVFFIPVPVISWLALVVATHRRRRRLSASPPQSLTRV